MLSYIPKVALSALLLAGYEANAFVLPSSSTSTRLTREEEPHYFSWRGDHRPVSRRGYSRRRPTTLNYLREPEANTERDFYSILGLQRTASEAEIKQAYRKLAKLYHPDANPDRDTTEQFKMLNRAYEVLRDPKLKQAYDVFGSKGIGTSAASDSENMARQRSTGVGRPTYKSSSGPSKSNTSGFYAGNANFATGWPSETSTSSSSSGTRSGNVNGAQARKPPTSGPYSSSRSGGGTSSSQARTRVVDPNPVGRTKSSSSTEYGTSGRSVSSDGNVRVDPSFYSSDPGFRSQSRASSTASSSTSSSSSGRSASSDGNVRVDPSFYSSDSGFRSQSRASSSTASSSTSSSRRDYASGPKADDTSVYFGDMGTVHTQSSKDMGKTVFTPRDGVSFTSGEAFFGRGPKFGRDVLVDLEIDLRAAKIGGTKVVQVKHMETCSHCSGYGTKDVTSKISTCHHCGGSGHTMNSSQMRETCPACLGTGSAIANPCGNCHGLGMQETTTSVQVAIPKDVKNGYLMRLPGKGDAGPNGGPAGDLYVCFKMPGASKKTKVEETTKTPQKVVANTAVATTTNNKNNKESAATPAPAANLVKELTPSLAIPIAEDKEVVPEKRRKRGIRKFLGGLVSSILDR